MIFHIHPVRPFIYSCISRSQRYNFESNLQLLFFPTLFVICCFSRSQRYNFESNSQLRHWYLKKYYICSGPAQAVAETVRYSRTAQSALLFTAGRSAVILLSCFRAIQEYLLLIIFAASRVVQITPRPPACLVYILFALSSPALNRP